MFSEQDRKIFKYFNGSEDVFADPLALNRKLQLAFDGDPAAAFEAAQPVPVPPEQRAELEAQGVSVEESPLARAVRLAAEQRLVDGLRQVFDLPAFDPKTGGGCLEETVWEVWAWYAEWLSGEASGAGN